MEGLPSGTVIGILTAKDPDEGENGTVYYSLSGKLLNLFNHILYYSLLFNRVYHHSLNFKFMYASYPKGSRAERFSLNPTSGELRTASPLRFTERSDYAFTVTAADHGTPGLSSSCQLRIQVRTMCIV